MKGDALKKLVSWAEARGIAPEDLDELVYEFKAAEASDINNGGLEAQLRYLLECCGNVAGVQEALRRELGL